MKKRIFAVLLCVCLLVGLLPTMAFAEEPTVSVWNGSSVATAYESGDGTETNPYEIATAEQFAYFAQRISSGYETEAHYVLSCDLDLSAANWTPIGGYPSNIFKGTFDGRGHTIQYVISSYSPTGPYYSFIGLFEYVEGDISNLDVEGSISLSAFDREVSLGGLSGIFDGNITNCDSNVDITYALNQEAVWIGGLTGQYRAGTIQECAYTGAISATGNTGQAVAGGICGALHSGTIDSCKNAGRVTCETNDSSAIDVAGGIVGIAISDESDAMLTVRNCYNEGAVSGNYAGGIICIADAYGGKISVENCYSSTMASGTAAQGALIGQSNVGDGTLTVQNCYYLTGTDYHGSIAVDLNELYEKLSASSQEGVWGKDATGAPRLYWEDSAAPEPTTYTLIVDLAGGNGSTTSDEYTEGAVINIDAGTRSHYRFSGWTSSNGGVFADASSPSTTFTMPAADTEITANWQYDVGTGKAVQIGASQIKGGQASSVYFGNYYQSDTTGTTKDPVKWRVLSDADGTLFLLSNQNLDAQPYNTSETSITWENCTLRTWLNETFLTAAFSNDEQGAIAQTHVANADNPTYNTPGGNNTTDKIFPLSIEEASNSGYFPNGDSSRVSTNTAYVASRSNSMSGVGGEDWWWLRSPGEVDSKAADVTDEGELNYGHSVASAYFAVRPAFNLDTDSVLFTSAADNSGHIRFGTALPDYSGSEWKVTLKDGNDFSSGASVSGTTSLTAGYSDTTLTISHAALSSLSGDYTDVTAALTDTSGNLLYYGSVNNSTSATESTVTIPAGLSEGTYTLSINGEDWNGANGTDYATGTPYTVTLTVTEAPHIHQYGTDWKTDANKHWHECACGHKSEEAGHSATDDGDCTTAVTCTVCGYVTKAAETSHSFTNYVSNNDATCTADGTKTAKCDHDGCDKADTQTDSGSAKGHTFGDWITVTSPTCTDKGAQQRTCSVCGYSETQDVDQNGHTWEADYTVDKAATCTEDGSKSIHCKNCDVVKDSEVIPTQGHKTEEIPAVAATCTEAGATAGEKCSVCGEILKEPETIPAKGHTAVEIPAVAATCTEAGATAGEKCLVCGEYVIAPEVIPAKGHTTVEIPAVAATCTEAGATAGEKCTVCGAITVEPQVIAAKGHAWDDGKVTKEPTLTDEGSMTYTCTVCGETKVETIEKLSVCDGGKDCPAYSYADVIKEAWYHLSVDYVIENKLMIGYTDGSFRPGNDLTRAEMVRIIYNWAGMPAVSGTPAYPDVVEDAWFTDAIIWATQNGVVEGYDNGNFGPNDKVTREQLAAMLYRYAGEPDVHGSLSKFKDADTASAYAEDALKWAVEQGILEGYTDDTLRPIRYATRAEIATMLKRYIEE